MSQHTIESTVDTHQYKLQYYDSEHLPITLTVTHGNSILFSCFTFNMIDIVPSIIKQNYKLFIEIMKDLLVGKLSYTFQSDNNKMYFTVNFPLYGSRVEQCTFSISCVEKKIPILKQ
jgi:hypothetical protein